MSPRERQIEVDDASVAEPVSAGSAVVDAPHAKPGPRAKPGAADDDVIRTGKLAGKGMWAAIWILSWPVLIESTLSSLVGVTDATLSAGVSESAADAVGGSAYILWAVGLVSIAVGVGGVALISRAMGKGRLAVASVVMGQCFWLSLIAGAGVGGAMALAAPTIASWMNLGPDASRDAVTFLRICALCVAQQSLLQTLIACCRGAGDSVRPLLIMALVNVVNVVVSFLLSGVDFAIASHDASGAVVRRVLIANPLDLDMGVAGIAIGTTIAWTLGCIVMVGVCARGVHGVRLRLKRLRPHWHTVRRLVRIGLPNFSETLGMWAGNFITVLMVGWMRDPGILGAHVIAIRIEAFSFLPGFAISLAAATLVGTYLGASRPDLARRAALRCLWIACALMGLCGLVFIFAPTTIAGLLSQQPTHLRVVPDVLRVAGMVQAAFAVAIVIRSVLRGAGDTASAAWLTWISIWGIRLPLAWLCCGVDLPLPWGGEVHNPAPLQSMGVPPLVGFWIGLCSELLIRATLFVIVFARGKWMRARV